MTHNESGKKTNLDDIVTVIFKNTNVYRKNPHA